MTQINQVLAGWIQKDMARRFTPKGNQLLNFTVSLPAGKDKTDDGEKNVYTYVRCTVWGDDLIDDIESNYKEGDLVQVSGYLKAGKPWTNKEGETKSSLDFTVFKCEHVR